MTDEKDPPRERYTFRAKAEINASYGKVRPPELVGRRVTDEEFVEILKRGIVTYTSMKVADVGRMIGEIGEMNARSPYPVELCDADLDAPTLTPSNSVTMRAKVLYHDPCYTLIATVGADPRPRPRVIVRDMQADRRVQKIAKHR